MMRILVKSALIPLFLVIAMNLKAQHADSQSRVKRNIIGAYAGIFELNVHYERNVIYRPAAQSNLRIGIGHGAFMVAGEGTYLNPTVAQLIGKWNSRLELNLGIIMMLSNSMEEPVFSDNFIPNVYAGYRYERAGGGIIIRAGISYPTILNAGIGYKF